MKKQRKQFTTTFKAKVALESVKGLKTIGQIASEHQLHVTQVNTWKKQLLENADSLFDRNTKGDTRSADEVAAPLYEEIGRLKMDIKWLEKKL